MSNDQQNKPKRVVLSLDTTYPIEGEINALIRALPPGERARIIRSMVLIGYNRIRHRTQQDGKGKDDDESGTL